MAMMVLALKATVFRGSFVSSVSLKIVLASKCLDPRASHILKPLKYVEYYGFTPVSGASDMLVL